MNLEQNKTFKDVDTCVFFDLETTGLYKDGKSPRITQFSMVACSTKELMNGTLVIVQKLTEYINPKIEVDPISQKLTGLNLKILKDLQEFNENHMNLIYTFLKTLNNPALFAHGGASLDYPLLMEMCEKFPEEKRNLFMFNIPCMETLKVFRRVRARGELQTFNCRLSNIYFHLFRKKMTEHNAESDSIMLMYCCRNFIDAFLEENFVELHNFKK